MRKLGWLARLAWLVPFGARRAGLPNRHFLISVTVLGVAISLATTVCCLVATAKTGIESVFQSLHAHVSLLPPSGVKESQASCELCKNPEKVKTALEDLDILSISALREFSVKTQLSVTDEDGNVRGSRNLELTIRTVGGDSLHFGSDIDRFAFRKWPSYFQQFDRSLLFEQVHPPWALFSANLFFVEVDELWPGDIVDMRVQDPLRSRLPAGFEFKVRFLTYLTNVSRLSGLPQNLMLLSNAAASNSLPLPGQASGCQIALENPDLADEAARILREKRGSDSCVVTSWNEAASSGTRFIELLQKIRWVVAGIVLLLLYVLLNREMSRIVLIQRTALALLLESGMTEAGVTTLFFISGLYTWLAGSLLGTGLSLLAYRFSVPFIAESIGQFGIADISLNMNWQEPIAIVCSAGIATMLSTLLPSRKAARTDVAETLARV